MEFTEKSVRYGIPIMMAEIWINPFQVPENNSVLFWEDYRTDVWNSRKITGQFL